MRIGILYNGKSLTRWSYEAVERIADEHEIYLLAAHGEKPPKRKLLRNGAYYGLNLLSIRNAMTSSRSFPDGSFDIAERIDFTISHDKAWAILPDEALKFARDKKLDAIIKFSLGLLRIPSGEEFSIPVLSYHHGDPRRYRGRPAGFYELVNREQHVGQVVQILSNKLDAGEILAAAHSPVIPHSYRKTLLAAYRLSPLLLPQALRALESGNRVDWDPEGRNYTLPSNLRVMRTVISTGFALINRLSYGAFVAKRWKVSTAPLTGRDDLVEKLNNGSPQGWRTVPSGPRHSFLADPFYYGDRGIIVEAMHARRGRGELMILDGDQRRVLEHEGSGHLSYPSHVEFDGEQLLLPESANWLVPTLFAVEGQRLVPRLALDIDVSRLLDPTLFEHGGHCYLFGNRVEEGPDVLRLWVAQRVDGRFEEHPMSPVRVSIRGSRMAGQLLSRHGQLIRVGQDRLRAYGDGVVLFAVEAISPECYRERQIGEASFRTVNGPHTLNIRGDEMVFDWYEDAFAPLAGVHRVMARLSSRL